MHHTWMVWVKQSSLSLSASLFCRLHRRAFCKKTLQPSSSWIRFRLTSLEGKSMGRHDPSNVLTNNATSSWEIWVSSQNFVRNFILVDRKKQWKRLKFETNILQTTYQNDPFPKKSHLKHTHRLSTCYQIYFNLQQTIFRHFFCIRCFFHCYFWVSNSFGDGGQCQLQMSWPQRGFGGRIPHRIHWAESWGFRTRKHQVHGRRPWKTWHEIFGYGCFQK